MSVKGQWQRAKSITDAEWDQRYELAFGRRHFVCKGGCGTKVSKSEIERSQTCLMSLGWLIRGDGEWCPECGKNPYPPTFRLSAVGDATGQP